MKNCYNWLDKKKYRGVVGTKILMLLLLVSVRCWGDLVNTKLDQTRSRKDEILSNYAVERDEKLVKLKEAYLGRLSHLYDKYTSSGDLDSVLVLKKERESIENDEPRLPNQSDPSDLVEVKKHYYSVILKVQGEYDQKVRKTYASYLTFLSKYERQMTKAGNIELALVIRQELESSREVFKLLEQNCEKGIMKTKHVVQNSVSIPAKQSEPVLSKPVKLATNKLEIKPLSIRSSKRGSDKNKFKRKLEFADDSVDLVTFGSWKQVREYFEKCDSGHIWNGKTNESENEVIYAGDGKFRFRVNDPGQTYLIKGRIFVSSDNFCFLVKYGENQDRQVLSFGVDGCHLVSCKLNPKNLTTKYHRTELGLNVKMSREKTYFEFQTKRKSWYEFEIERSSDGFFFRLGEGTGFVKIPENVYAGWIFFQMGDGDIVKDLHLHNVPK